MLAKSCIWSYFLLFYSKFPLNIHGNEKVFQQHGSYIFISHSQLLTFNLHINQLSSLVSFIIEGPGQLVQRFLINDLIKKIIFMLGIIQESGKHFCIVSHFLTRKYFPIGKCYLLGNNFNTGNTSQLENNYQLGKLPKRETLSYWETLPN